MTRTNATAKIIGLTVGHTQDGVRWEVKAVFSDGDRCSLTFAWGDQVSLRRDETGDYNWREGAVLEAKEIAARNGLAVMV
jgi:hypothetical protein